MIEERASVVHVEDQFAWIEAQRNTVCGGCSLNNGCGVAILDNYFGRRFARVRALNPINARTGDQVAVGIPEQGVVKGSLAIYAVPLLCMLCFTLLGAALPIRVMSQETSSILFALLGLVIGFGWLALFARRVNHHPHYNLVVIRRVSRDQATFSEQHTE